VNSLTADCRLQAGVKMQTEGKMETATDQGQNADCRLLKNWFMLSVRMHARSLESTKEAQALLKAIAESNS